ncbi:uncharacterized protein METZ01_LOCUS339753, partial [marine metagenome]
PIAQVPIQVCTAKEKRNKEVNTFNNVFSNNPLHN